MARKAARLSKKAIDWIWNHKDELASHGWTRPELWRRNRSLGIAFLGLWERPGVRVDLTGAGSIVFTWRNPVTGETIKQTARPRCAPHAVEDDTTCQDY